MSPSNANNAVVLLAAVPRQGDEPRAAPPGKTDTATDAGASPGPAPVAEPSWIGPYRLLAPLGEGGMGTVWLAQQEEPVQRKVAVKVIKAGMDTRQVVARFESERQALALMNHPAIAKVFDGGSTAEGRPFFVMEFVDGENLTRHCDRERLAPEQRLALLAEVCAGVQHAHQKAVIHRDLKPSNILVALEGGEAQPKIIDFGIAKAMGQQLSEHTLQTAAGVVIGTLEYMSPEQADPTGADVDTRTDVYSLGVILYELLTGELPFSSRDLRSSNPDDLRRKLREVDPPRPSARVSNPAITAEVARNRNSDPGQLRRKLRGDLDAITMKALEKDRARRYATPSELAADLGRYLRNEPVLAQPPSAGYRARKYIRRNRALVAGAAAVFTALAVGLVASSLQARRARLAERKAESEAAVAKATSEFLQKDLLGQADVAQQAGKPDPDIKVRTVLDRAAAKIEGKFAGQPGVEVSIRGTIGEAYRAMGLYPEADRHLERALEVGRSSLGADSLQTLFAAATLAKLYNVEARYPQAEALVQETLERQTRVLGPEHPDSLRSLALLASVFYNQGKLSEAEAALLRVLALQRRALGPEHRETLVTMLNLANVYTVTNRLDAAEPLYRQSLDAQRRTLGPEHPDAVATMNGLAALYSNGGRYREASALLGELLPLSRRVLGREHPRTLHVLNNAVDVDLALGRYAEAEAAALEAYEIRRNVLGPGHDYTLDALVSLGRVYQALGRYGQAEAAFREARAGLLRQLGAEAVRTLDTVDWLGAALSAQGRFAEAAALVEGGLEVRRRTQGKNYRDTVLTQQLLAVVYAARGRLPEAAALQDSLLEPLGREVGPEKVETLTARAQLAQTLCWQGEHARADALFTEVAGVERRVLGPDDRATLDTLRAQGTCALRQGQHGKAATLLGEALEGFRATLGEEHPLTLDTAVSLAVATRAQGKPVECERLARTALRANEKVRPDSWQRHFSACVLGACLTAGGQRAEAARLLRAGLTAMEGRRPLMPVPERDRIGEARGWLADSEKRALSSR